MKNLKRSKSPRDDLLISFSFSIFIVSNIFSIISSDNSFPFSFDVLSMINLKQKFSFEIQNFSKSHKRVFRFFQSSNYVSIKNVLSDFSSSLALLKVTKLFFSQTTETVTWPDRISLCWSTNERILEWSTSKQWKRHWEESERSVRVRKIWDWLNFLNNTSLFLTKDFLNHILGRR